MAQSDYGANHHAFIVDSLAEIDRRRLKALNIPLVYFVGEVIEVLEELQSVHQSIHSTHSHMEVGGGVDLHTRQASSVVV